MMKIIFFIVSLLFVCLSHAGEDDRRKLQGYVKRINQLTNETFLDKLKTIQLQVDSFFLKKRGVCSGEYLADILTNSSEPIKSNKKLSVTKENERKIVCFTELKKFQLTYYNALYQRKYAFSEFLHQEKMGQLENSFHLFIEEINAEFKKVEKRIKTNKRKKKKRKK